MLGQGWDLNLGFLKLPNPCCYLLPYCWMLPGKCHSLSTAKRGQPHSGQQQPQPHFFCGPRNLHASLLSCWLEDWWQRSGWWRQHWAPHGQGALLAVEGLLGCH
jgi:hypothetical protein